MHAARDVGPVQRVEVQARRPELEQAGALRGGGLDHQLERVGGVGRLDAGAGFSTPVAVSGSMLFALTDGGSVLRVDLSLL